jgi:predicted NBD/HSP70 family sugar kinase
MQKADKETIKKNNRKVILNWLKDQDLSRTDLALLTGLSNSTVSSLVYELTMEGFVFEKSVAESSGGRKPIILSVNPDVAYALLVKIVQYRIVFAIVDLKLRVVYRREFPFVECSEDCITEAVQSGIVQVLDDNASIRGKITGVGVSIPGLVEHHTDKVLLSSLLHLRNMDITSVIQAKIKSNVYVFKDTDALMLGEYILKGLNSNDSYLYLLVDSGVGLSFMNKGEILQLNRSGFEIGHVQLDDKGPQCNCGNYGCVEAFVSEQAARRDLKGISSHDLSYQVDIDKLKYSDIVSRSNEGDRYAADVLFHQCAYLGRVVALVINLYAPNMVLIGGPLSGSKYNILEAVEKSAAKSELEIFRTWKTSIKFTNTGDNACFIGMANKIFNVEFFEKEL